MKNFKGTENVNLKYEKREVFYMGLRKGISFTLTIIIVGVVLLAGALTLITMFTTVLTDNIGVMRGLSHEAQVERRCSNIINDIQGSVCERTIDLDELEEDNIENVGSGDIDSSNQLKSTRFIGGGTTCNEVNCFWTNIIDESFDEKMTVTVDGEQYNCANVEFVDNQCPITESSSSVLITGFSISVTG